MLYNYNELLQKYNDNYNINKAIKNKEIFKISKGIYSDAPNVHYLAVLLKKYPTGVISGHSAYYYYNLTDIIPRKITLCTNRISTRIHSDNVKQIRMQDDLYNLGITTMDYEGVKIRIYDKERLLIDLARNKNKMGYDLYKEIISNYREIADTINMRKIEEYLTKFNNGDNLFDILMNEVF